MTTAERAPADPDVSSVHDLEALWRVGDEQRAAGAPRPSLGRRAPRVSLVHAWIATLVYSVVIAPYASADAVEPSWSGEALFVFVLSAVAIVPLGVMLGQVGAYVGSAVAGVCGCVVAYGCGASAHHQLALAGLELLLFAGIAALSVVRAVGAARRGSQSTSSP